MFKSSSVPASLKAPYERSSPLCPIEAICLIPKFTIENANENPALVKAFYKVAIKLSTELKLPSKNFAYYRDNFVPYEMRSNILTMDQLIDYLGWEMLKPRRHDSRFMMGFRSLSFILRNNIDQIDTYYIGELHEMLTPFYKVYQHPHYLIWGCKFGE